MPTMLRLRPMDALDFESSLDRRIGEKVTLKGIILRLRHMTWGSFIVISLPRCCVQCVASKDIGFATDTLREGDIVSIYGELLSASIKDLTIWPRNAELRVERIEIINKAVEAPPIDISKKILANVGLDLKLNTRPISLRHPRERAVFKISEGACRGFRHALLRRGFTEIHTPKIVSAGAEGGSNVFRIDYFGSTAYLAQSPQFYKQMGVGIYGRVFEIGPVFRAEKHRTSRHVNEYTSLDMEMGFIEDQTDVMNVLALTISETFRLLSDEYGAELEMLDVATPVVPEEIPCVTLEEAHLIASKRLKMEFLGQPDLDPIEEREMCTWASQEYGTEFIFVTAFPSTKRPFYAMDDPEHPELALSFDLLFRGMEITTGGQRIHGYEEQVQKLVRFGLNPENFQYYLMIHKHGIPPHGGFGMGLERLVNRLLRLENIREATMFPRDMLRLDP